MLGDGSIYNGMWRYGKRSGLGTFYFNNGDVFQGSWRDDAMHGKVLCFQLFKLFFFSFLNLFDLLFVYHYLPFAPQGITIIKPYQGLIVFSHPKYDFFCYASLFWLIAYIEISNGCTCSLEPSLDTY